MNKINQAQDEEADKEQLLRSERVALEAFREELLEIASRCESTLKYALNRLNSSTLSLSYDGMDEPRISDSEFGEIGDFKSSLQPQPQHLNTEDVRRGSFESSISYLSIALDRQNMVIKSFEKRLYELEDALARSADALQIQNNLKEQAEAQAAQSAAEVRTLILLLEESRNQIKSIFSSTSWRITYPMRSVKDRLSIVFKK